MVTKEQLKQTKTTVESYFGRKVLAVFPVGSHTMNLVLPGSDLDQVVVVAPSVHDLFESSRFSGKLAIRISKSRMSAALSKCSKSKIPAY